MSAATAMLVWLLPVLVGSGIWAACCGWPRRAHGLLAAIGGGWILGACACGLLARVLAADDLAAAPVRVGVVAALLGVAGWAVAWRRRVRFEFERPTRLEAIVATVLLVLLGLRAWMLAIDILMHPTLPWDAWAVWQAKAKAAVLAGHWVPYVSFDEWLAARGDLRTTHAWRYPELLPWILVWFAGASGWVEPLINLSWLVLWAALLLVLYGQWRTLGLPRLVALVGVYGFGSLPLVDAHVALGGYADLWLAAVLAMGVQSWLLWSCRGETRQVALVALALLLLPMIKLEGAAWAIALGGACVLTTLPLRIRAGRRMAGIALVVCAVALSFALGSAWIGAALEYLSDGLELDPMRIARSFGALANALWGQWNWNLLWFALPVLLWCGRREWMSDPVARRLAEFVAVSFCAIVALFAFTTASRYAQSYSAVNRLLLQATPLLVGLLGFALRAALGNGLADGMSLLRRHAGSREVDARP